MVENQKETKFDKLDNQLLKSLISFKNAFDKKMSNPVTKTSSQTSPPKENFINIYKTTSINSEISENMANMHKSHLVKSLNIKNSDIFYNSEILLSNIDDIINKDVMTCPSTIVRVPTSDSLTENDSDEQKKSDEIQRFSPCSTGMNFHHVERLNSIDEKDESKEEDTVSKSSKEKRNDEKYYIINQTEFEKQKKNENLQKNNEKDDIHPKFVFLDYKEFKNKSEHNHINNDEKNKNIENIEMNKSDYSLSMNAIPNNSSVYKKKPISSHKRNLKLDDLDANSTSLEKQKNMQRKTPVKKSIKNYLPISASVTPLLKNIQNKYTSSFHSPRNEIGSPAFLINLKAYSALKEKSEKKMINNSLNLSKKVENPNAPDNKVKKPIIDSKLFLSTTDSINNINIGSRKSSIYQLKEKTQKDIELIDKEISEELLIFNNKNTENTPKRKKNKTKSSSCNEQEILEYKNSASKIDHAKDLKKIDKNQKILKNIGKCNSKEKENEKNTNINVNPISSRKNSNSKIYCEPIIYGTPNKAKSKLPFKENGRNSQSEKKTSTLKKANELKQNFKTNFLYYQNSSKIIENKKNMNNNNENPSNLYLLKSNLQKKLNVQPKIKQNTSSLLRNSSNLEKNQQESLQKQLSPKKCPKDLWEEIKQIYNLFNAVDGIVAPKNQSLSTTIKKLKNKKDPSKK